MISLNKGVEQTPMHERYNALYPLSSKLISHPFRWNLIRATYWFVRCVTVFHPNYSNRHRLSDAVPTEASSRRWDKGLLLIVYNRYSQLMWYLWTSGWYQSTFTDILWASYEFWISRCSPCSKQETHHPSLTWQSRRVVPMLAGVFLV